MLNKEHIEAKNPILSNKVRILFSEPDIEQSPKSRNIKSAFQPRESLGVEPQANIYQSR